MTEDRGTTGGRGGPAGAAHAASADQAVSPDPAVSPDRPAHPARPADPALPGLAVQPELAAVEPAPSRPERTKAALIAGAIESLREVGYAGTSAREIARRAACNQALIFYHFGSVTDLLLAALDDVSARRLAAYSELLDSATTLTDLIDSAQQIFAADLAAGHLAVLAEMVAGARATEGLGPRVAARLVPWRDVAAKALRTALDRSPVAGLIAPDDLAHGVVAGFLGLELLADLDGSPDAALALFDRARGIAALLDLLGGAFSRHPDPRDGAIGRTGAAEATDQHGADGER
jgi:AcrR family transcriptional regulator